MATIPTNLTQELADQAHLRGTPRSEAKGEFGDERVRDRTGMANPTRHRGFNNGSLRGNATQQQGRRPRRRGATL